MKILKSIYNFLDSMSCAHSASHLARNGDHVGAKKMMEDFRGWI